MSSFRPRRPSAALVVSVIALIVALGGTAYAGGLVPGKNTVGTKQLKRNAVTTSKIKNGQVTNSKISNGAVTASKINPTGLTVPNALQANTATTAGSATNATNATNATKPPRPAPWPRSPFVRAPRKPLPPAAPPPRVRIRAIPRAQSRVRQAWWRSLEGFTRWSEVRR